MRHNAVSKGEIVMSKSIFSQMFVWLSLIGGLYSIGASKAYADQTINEDFPTSCVSQGGILGDFNFITDFDNGTFGVENGQPNQTPAVDPYPNQVDGGVFDEFFDINFGDYAYIANITTPRNRFQHPDVDNSPGAITDPENGATGRFFASDPNANTPTLNFSITNIDPNENYELAFWAVNSELQAIPNIVNAVVDGIVSFSTGELIAVRAALPWQRYAFVFNAGDRTVITLAMASTETGQGGRDFYVDNVTLRRCFTTPAQTGGIEGTVYIDDNGNNNFDAATEATLSNIEVQLFETQSDGNPDNDIFISSANSGPDGTYSFENLLPDPDYEVRVNTADPDLAAGLVSGTPNSFDAPVTAGQINTDNDFGFDATAAVLTAVKTVAMFDPDNAGLFAVPGNEVIYTITVTNRGDGQTDNNALFLVDDLPDEVEFFTGDFDGVGGATGNSVLFEQNNANLNFDFGRDVGFSRSAVPPANFAACNDTPTGTYDATINFICFAPNGQMQSDNPDPSFSVSFRARIE